MGRGEEDRIEDEIWEGKINNNGFLKSHMEIYYCNTFLKYVHL